MHLNKNVLLGAVLSDLLRVSISYDLAATVALRVKVGMATAIQFISMDL